MLRSAVVMMLALALLAVVTLAGQPARAFVPAALPDATVVAPAFAGVDPCYKKCFMDKAWGEQRKFVCRRACNANPKKQCEDRCWKEWANFPRERKGCLSRC